MDPTVCQKLTTFHSVDWTPKKENQKQKQVADWLNLSAHFLSNVKKKPCYITHNVYRYVSEKKR